MTAAEQSLRWPSTRRSFDALAAEAHALRISVDEAELLRTTHWELGQDARLREDFRFRPTPWNRWILSESFLANDAVCAQLHRERRPSLGLETTLAALDNVVRRRCVVCPSDPRLVVSDGEVRLSARELTDHPLLESSVTDLERYVTHLPLHSLRAAAASVPAGEWGQRAQEQVIETLGWVRVSLRRRRLNQLMFVAQIEGHSMDDGRSGLVDGGYAVFELWPTETKRSPVVLARGAFTDPETGSYAVKKIVGDLRGKDGRHGYLKLVSLNPDRGRFPDIDLEPNDDSGVTVVAELVQELTPDDFARLPRVRVRRGRRDLASSEARADIAKQLEDHANRFFESEPTPEEDGAPQKETWGAALICLDSASGGLHLEVGPLRGLWSFVKRLRASGEGWDAIVLASNVRERPARISVPPSSGPWKFTAVDFEDDPDIDLSKLHLNGLDGNHAYVFRVDAEGIGRAHKSLVLSPGQRYRVLISSPSPEGPIRSQRLEAAGAGWLLWEIELVRPVPTEVIEAARQLGLAIGEASPALEWVVTAPSDWRTNARGESYACFAPTPGPIAQFRESHVEVTGDAVVFLHGASETVTRELPVGERHLVHLSSLAPGRYVLALVHRRTAVASMRAAFEILDAFQTPPRATAQLSIGDEVHCARSGHLIAATARDMGDAETAKVLESLRVSAPPGWPVRVLWKEIVEETLLRRSMNEQGAFEGGGLLAAARERFTRRPIGDVVFDFAELGRVALPHDRHPQPESVRARVSELLAARGATVERLAGAYSDLLPIWFEPVCAALGFDVERMPDGLVAEAPEHATVMRLFSVERRGARIERKAVRLLVLVERLTTSLSLQMLTWIDEACAKEQIRDALLSDGLCWATHRRTSRLALRIWDLKAIASDADEFVSFLRVASEGV
jgi:hypothetical protein